MRRPLRPALEVAAAVALMALPAKRGAADELARAGPREPTLVWVDRLRSPDPATREEAARVLALRGEEAVLPLLERLRVADWKEKRLALDLLGRLPGSGTRDVLVSALRDPSWVVRTAAAHAVSRHPRVEEIPSVLGLLDDPVWAVRYAAVGALADRMHGRVDAALERAAREDADPDVRRRAVEVLLERGRPPALDLLERYRASAEVDERDEILARIFNLDGEPVRRFFAKRAQSGDPSERIASAAWLARHGETEVLDSREILHALLTAAQGGGATAEIRGLAGDTLLLAGPGRMDAILDLLPEVAPTDGDLVARLVARLAGARAPAVLADLLADERFAPYRTDALRLLREAAEPAGIEAVRAFLDRHPSSPARRHALAILAAFEPERTLPRLEAALRDPDPNVRRLAVAEFARAGVTDPIVRTAVEDPSPIVRRRAAALLAGIPGDEARRALVRLARADPDDGVRRTAITWLGRRDDAGPGTLRAMLASEPDVTLQAIAVRSLAGSLPPSERGFLLDLGGDPDEPWPVRHEAYRAIARLGTDGLGDSLERRLARSSETAERRAILRILGRTPRACEFVLSALDDTTVRLQALSILERLECPQAVARLADSVTSDGWDLESRVVGVELLARRRGAADVLLELAGSPSAPLEVRAAAIRALAEVPAPDLRDALAGIVERTGGPLDAPDEERALIFEEAVASLATLDARTALDAALARWFEAPDEPARSRARSTVGRVLQRAGEDAALQVLPALLDAPHRVESVAKLAPGSLLSLARSVDPARRPRLARELFERVLRFGGTGAPTFEAALRAARLAEAAGDARCAAGHYRRAFRLAVRDEYRDERARTRFGSSPTRSLLARAVLMEGIARLATDPAGATAELARAARLARGDREALLATARHLLEAGHDPALALDVAERARRLAPDSREARLAVAEACRASGDLARAAAIYEAVARDPQVLDPRLLVGAAMLRARSGDPERGWSDLEAALRKDPDLLPLVRDQEAFAPFRPRIERLAATLRTR